MVRRPAVVHVWSPLRYGGGEQRLVALYEHLAREGVPQLVACAAGSELERICRARDLRYLALRRRTGLDPLFARGVSRAAAALRADVVHAHDAHAHAAAVLACALFRARAAVVVDRGLRSPARRGALSRWKYDHPSVRRILCASAAVRDVLRAAVRDASRLEIVDGGVARGARPSAAVTARRTLEIYEELVRERGARRRAG
ncbi:glycosyltransferase [Anaeromyxobacter oryzae]|uniref:Glycosyltransferase subfamily 4-like N-terminal domain-containing protein n=1 Tax=Anaeromyxobacter oryzae TaxID=2918170 RepID=A0ABM7WWY7_9BACT|nr:glycosyltransferase [Anaeromyxobacter oryzae]BDG04027.1 hypothetical protein AMOR_30230 [Anaeromyxobacter oryzae]